MVFILVVTSDPEIGKQLKQILGAQGWWVTQVEDRQGALRAAADHEPELLIVDSSASGAVDLIRTFASENGGPGALVLGPPGQHDETFALFEAGADEILSSPPRSEELVRAVHRVAALPHRRTGAGPVVLGEQLTAAEIFGDILSEVEGVSEDAAAFAAEGDEVAPPATVTAETEAPASAGASFPPGEEESPPLAASEEVAPEPVLRAPDERSGVGDWEVPLEPGVEAPPAVVRTPTEEAADEYGAAFDRLAEQWLRGTEPPVEAQAVADGSAEAGADSAALAAAADGAAPSDAWVEEGAALGGVLEDEVDESAAGIEEESSATGAWVEEGAALGGVLEGEVYESAAGVEEESSATDAWGEEGAALGGVLEGEVYESAAGVEEESSATDAWGEEGAALGGVLEGEVFESTAVREETASEPGIGAEGEDAAVAARAGQTVVPPLTGAEERFGQYRLEERVAVGGMAEVWRASMSGLEGFRKTVAIKKILPHLADNEDFVAMFIDEAKLAAQLNHENLVDIYDLGKIGSDFFIAMEFVDGQDLRSILNCLRRIGDRMPLGLALFITAKTAGALEYAHARRDAEGEPLDLVHRDVSPRNILIGYDGNIRLCDFGVAKAVSSVVQTEIGALKGKLQYMSPEQASGARVDARSDIFSLGSVLFELVTGRRLFVEDTEISLLEAVRRGVVDEPQEVAPGLPEELNRVLLKALEKDPGDRYQSAGAMQRELEELIYTLTSKPTQKALGHWVSELFEKRPRPDGEEVSARAASVAAAASTIDTVPAREGEVETATVADGEVETRPLALNQLVRQRRFWLGVAAGLAVAVATTATLEFVWREKESHPDQSVPAAQEVTSDAEMPDPASEDGGEPSELEALVDREMIRREAEIRGSLDEERRRLLEELERLRSESENGESPPDSLGSTP